MKVTVNPNITSELKHLKKLMKQLYPNNWQPGLTNVNDASMIVLVEEENTTLGFVMLYETIPGYLTLGNYQCVNNLSVAQMLFDKVKHLATLNGYEKIIGPMNGNTWHSYRFNTKTTPPFFLEHIHQPYYVQQWQMAGFKPFAQYFTFEEVLKNYEPNQRNLNWLNDKPNLSVRHFNVNNVEQDLSLLYHFCIEAFKYNLLYTPINESSFKKLYQPILPYLKNDLIDLVIEKVGKEERLVGFLFAVEDLYNPSQLIAKTIARKTGEAYKGLAHFLAERLLQKATKKGYTKLLHAYIEGSNKSLKLSQKFGGENYQEHILLSLDL